MPRNLNPEDAARIAKVVAAASERVRKENEKTRRKDAFIMLMCAAALAALVFFATKL